MSYLAIAISSILAILVVIQFFWLRQLQQQLAALIPQVIPKTSEPLPTANRPTTLELLDKQHFEQEINTVWSEMENLRSDLLARVANTLTLQDWQQFLANQIPNYAQLRVQLSALQQAEPTVALSLTTHLPAYLLQQELLPSLITYLQFPFERINWLEIAILPIEAALQRKSNPTLQESFSQLLTALRYELIAPTTAESWQPEKHEILEQHRSEQPRGTVLKVRRPGYQYQAQIIRKAQIIISAGN